MININHATYGDPTVRPQLDSALYSLSSKHGKMKNLITLAVLQVAETRNLAYLSLEVDNGLTDNKIKCFEAD